MKSKDYKKKELEYINDSIDILNIDLHKKLILKGRFLYLINKYKSNKLYYIIFYDVGRFIVIIGSISIPALLSTENYMDKKTAFWLIWSISLLVSLINGYITLFKLDKKYYSTITIIEKLACEFWQYMCLCGKYSGSYGHSIPTHENQFVFFTNNIERIQIKNIEEIYIKLLDTSKQQEEKNPIPSISEESYNKSSEFKDDIQEKSKVHQLKNVIIT
jgi:hypothetical protein